MQMNISEDLYEKIIGGFYEGLSCRFNKDYTRHMGEVHTDTIELFEQMYDKGLEQATLEAYKRYNNNEQPTWSKGICESLTVGYGKLDEYGYFEFPLVLREEDGTIISLEELLEE